jgi:putative isomerase
MSAIENLHNRIDLTHIPFTDRGSRLLLFREENSLFVRLAERWTKWEAEVGHYRKRPPIIGHLMLLDANGVPMDLDTDTYPHVATLVTASGKFDWVFIDPEAMLIRLPSGCFGFQFEAFGQDGQVDRRGGALHGKRNIAYTTSARIIKNEVSPLRDGFFRVTVMVEAQDGDGLVLNITPRLGYNRSIPVSDQAIAEARSRWQEWFDATPPVLDIYRPQYDYAWWVMRIGLLNTRYYFTREAAVPSKIHYVGVWHWDQFFHALAYRHIDAKLAEDQLRILFDHQRDDGMFPDAIHDEGLVTHLVAPVDADVTKPPLMAWTVLKLFEKSGRLDFLHEAYEPLSRWNRWWVEFNTDEKTGLCEYRHPFSSGLDDSPLWDDGMPIVAPDLNTYMYLQEESLARIAELIGETEDAAKFRQQADERLQRMVTWLWDDALGLFNALYKGERVRVLSPFSLLPLWTGHLPNDMMARLLRHLTDPTTFWPEWPLPTVAISDPKFDPWQMWRGPTWVNINYLFIEALMQIGQHELARRLRRRSLELVMQHNDIYEYYNPITAERPPKAAPIFGWTSAVFIDMAIQETQLST